LFPKGTSFGAFRATARKTTVISEHRITNVLRQGLTAPRKIWNMNMFIFLGTTNHQEFGQRQSA